MTGTEPQPADTQPPAGPIPTGSVVTESNAHLIGPVGMIIAGLLGLIGGLLPWVSVSVSAGGGVSQSIQGPSPLTGLSATDGGPSMAVVLGALVVLCAAWYLFGRRDRRLLHVTAVLSLLLFGLGVFKIIDLYRQANDFFNRMSDLTGRVPAPFGGGGESLNFRDMFHIDPAPGLWMVAVSGLLGTVLSLFVLRQTRQQVSGASGPVTPPTGPAVPPGDLWAGDPAPQ